VLPGMRGAVESMNSPASAPLPWRLALLGGVSCLLYLLGSIWQPPLERTNYLWYFLWFSGVFVVYVLALLDTRRYGRPPHPVVIPLIVGWALIFRISVLWVTPGFLSDDIYRYVWDGLVQQAGINPYDYPPEAPELGFLRDDTIFPMINRKSVLTLYPPGAQLFFRLMAWLRPANLVAMKAVILLADALSIAILLLLLRHLGIYRAKVLLYAWHPLVIVELGISGHLDGLMIPFVLLAFLCMMQHRPWRVGASLAMAALIKLYPAILLPVLYRKAGWQMPLAFFGLMGAGYLLYLDAGQHIVGYLPTYIAPFEFYNLSLRPILMWLAGLIAPDPFPYVKSLSSVVLVVVMVQYVRQTHKTHQQAVQWGVGLIALYLLLVSPSVFQWYLVWLLALLPLTQSWLTPAWLYWSWSVNLGYLESQPVFAGALPWLRIVEYVPVLLWILGYWWLGYAGTQVLTQKGTINTAS
jgi:alpha-1,6-mannosyltransferase